MRNKGKGAKSSKTLADNNGESEVEIGYNGKGFYACYLLTSLSPRHKGHTYIGFTVNPKRRIRQHNGEITSGATRTKKKRPWEMTLCIYGFPTQVAALQFEWAWQHPTESLAVRKAACNLKSVAGFANKIIVAFTMLTLHTWQSMDLTVNFFSTKYMSHVAACPSLPKQMKVQFGTMDDLPCYSSGNQPLNNDEDDWDLDPQECNSSDEVEDLTRGNSDDGIRHCFDASASSTDNQADNESRQSQENDVLEPRDSVFHVEDDDYQKHYYEVDRLHQEFNAPVHDCAEKPAMTRKASTAIEDRGYNQVHPSNERSPPLPEENNVLEPRDLFFLIEDDGCQKHSNEVDQSDQEFNTPMRVCAEKSAMTRTTTVVIEDTPCSQAQPSEERSPLSKGATDETQSATFRQIEVIDLFTPSPVYRDNTHSKKRKVDTEVIDLTRSPDFIEL